MTEKITVSVLLDPKVYEQVKELQSKTGIFSRSALLRKVIDTGLKEVSKSGR